MLVPLVLLLTFQPHPVHARSKPAKDWGTYTTASAAIRNRRAASHIYAHMEEEGGKQPACNDFFCDYPPLFLHFELENIDACHEP